MWEGVAAGRGGEWTCGGQDLLQLILARRIGNHTYEKLVASPRRRGSAITAHHLHAVRHWRHLHLHVGLRGRRRVAGVTILSTRVAVLPRRGGGRRTLWAARLCKLDGHWTPSPGQRMDVIERLNGDESL